METVDVTGLAFFEAPESDDGGPHDPTMEDESESGDSDSAGEYIDLYDLITTDVSEPQAMIRLPKALAKTLGIPSPIAEFRFLDQQAEQPKKNAIVIVRHDGMTHGDEKVRLACGKLLWQRQVDVNSGGANVLVTIRGKGTPVKFKLSSDEWDQFRPLAVIQD